jgi:hypothetical protein
MDEHPLRFVGVPLLAGVTFLIGFGALYSWAQTTRSPEDYSAAVWDKIHFPPAIDKATDQQCLACHQEVLDTQVRSQTPAGLKADDVLAWYQTLDTYSGKQETFHRRHLVTAYGKEVMNLSCNFCHRGEDPRENAPGSSATAPAVGSDAGFTLRKTFDPSHSCLRCHGKFQYEIMGLPGPWPEVRPTLETGDVKNGCLVCHAEMFRTNRHKVTYLYAEKIEELAKDSSDVCFGCHGGRAWYRISFPYPRHSWPGMDPVTPDWAKDRPTQSEAEFRIEGGDK